MMKKLQQFSGILIFCTVVLALKANAQTNEFTFQGKLTNTETASATYDFEFRLCPSSLVCSPVLQRIERLGVPVANGIFNVTLDFDAAHFTGGSRYLQIGVRRVGSADAWTTLSPAQKITSVPYAIKSLTAATSDNSLRLGDLPANQYVLTNDSRLSDDRNPLPDSPNYIRNSISGQASSNFNISGNGNVGTDLTVGQNATVGNSLSVGANAQIGNILSASTINASGNLTAGNTNVAALTATRFSTSGNLAVGGNTIVTGDLGVGTNLPAAKLHVAGSGIFTADLNVDGSTTVGNSLFVATSGSFGSSVSANSLSVTGSLTAGNTTLGTLNASSLTTTGNVAVRGNATFNGTLRLGAFATNPSVCTVASAGTIYYRGNDPAIVLCNGTNWVRLASAVAQPIAQESFELTNIISEQQKQIERQNDRIETQQRQIDALKQSVCELKPEAIICGKDQK